MLTAMDPTQKFLRGLSEGMTDKGQHFTVFRLDPDKKKLRKSKSKLRLSFSHRKSTLASQEGATPSHASNFLKIA